MANSSIELTLQEYCATMNGIAEQIRKLQEENTILVIENEALQKNLLSERNSLENMSSECLAMKRVS